MPLEERPSYCVCTNAAACEQQISLQAVLFVYLTGKAKEEIHLDVKDAGALAFKHGVALPVSVAQGGVPSTLTALKSVALENFEILVKNSARPSDVSLELRVSAHVYLLPVACAICSCILWRTCALVCLLFYKVTDHTFRHCGRSGLN